MISDQVLPQISLPAPDGGIRYCIPRMNWRRCRQLPDCQLEPMQGLNYGRCVSECDTSLRQYGPITNQGWQGATRLIMTQDPSIWSYIHVSSVKDTDNKNGLHYSMPLVGCYDEPVPLFRVMAVKPVQRGDLNNTATLRVLVWRLWHCFKHLPRLCRMWGVSANNYRLDQYCLTVTSRMIPFPNCDLVSCPRDQQSRIEARR